MSERMSPTDQIVPRPATAERHAVAGKSKGLVWGTYISSPALYVNGKLYASLMSLGSGNAADKGWLVFIHGDGSRTKTDEIVALTEDDARRMAETRASRRLTKPRGRWDWIGEWFALLGCSALLVFLGISAAHGVFDAVAALSRLLP